MGRAAAAVGLVALAAVLHMGFCEWRTLEFEAERAGEADAFALWEVRRVEHAEGNAPAWDARKRALRAYHTDWLACWSAEPEAAACADRDDPGRNATVRAVAQRACAEERGLALVPGARFERCLAERGHAEPRPPRWTRDDFGPRFDGPWVSVTGLFAEPFALSPGPARALAWWRGMLAPAALCAGAIWLVVRGYPPRRAKTRSGASPP